MTTPLEKTCPRCGARITAQAPEGLCPRCVAEVNLLGESVFTNPAAAEQAPSIEELAPHFPQLEVLEYLGRGGMGVVYKARQRTLGRVVALKLLAPERVADAKFAARFAQEAKALAALSHPNIVTIYDFGQAGGFYYLLMEYVDGVNLRQAMKAGRFTPEQALSIVPPVCEGLQYAHDHGVVHRDIKPENLLLDREGRVKIADFGIAKMLGDDAPGVSPAESQPAGTPQYMAPEQRLGPDGAGNRSDIYSLGVVLYEMLTGELPAASGMQPPSRRIRVDVRIDEIVLRALETKPELRYATAADFREQVEGVVHATSSGSKEQAMPRGAASLRIWPLHVVFFYVLFTAGAFILDGLHAQSGSAHAGMASTSLVVTLILAALARRNLNSKLVSGSSAQRSSASSWLKLCSFLGFFCAVPALLLGGFFALALFYSRGDWNPASAEAIMVPLIMLGAVLLPWGAAVLWKEATQHRPSQSEPGWAGKLLRALFFLLAGLIVTFAFAVTIYLAKSRTRPVASVTTYTPEVIKNAVVVDIETLPNSDSGVAVWFALEGPSLTPEAQDAVSDLKSKGIEVLQPGLPSQLMAPQVMSQPTKIRMGFVLPSEAMAKNAASSFRPIGPLEIATDRAVGGTLFEVWDEHGKSYRAFVIVGASEYALEAYRRESERLTQSAAKGEDDSIEKPAAVPAASLMPHLADRKLAPPTPVPSRFPLRHRLASAMIEDLRPILADDKTAEVSASANNQELAVKASPEMMARIGTVIVVTDWPDALKNAATGEYLTDSVTRSARSFFHACAMQDTASVARLLSLATLAQLKNAPKTAQYESYTMGGTPDPGWEASLREDWEGKEEALRRVIKEWNRFPLKRITEDAGVAIGFGVKHFCSVAFEGAPKEFYQVTIEPGRGNDAEKGRYYFSSPPPWRR